MDCNVIIFQDGSWLCQKCDLAGDKDEPVEQYCKNETMQSAKEDSEFPLR